MIRHTFTLGQWALTLVVITLYGVTYRPVHDAGGLWWVLASVLMMVALALVLRMRWETDDERRVRRVDAARRRSMRAMWRAAKVIAAEQKRAGK